MLSQKLYTQTFQYFTIIWMNFLFCIVHIPSIYKHLFKIFIGAKLMIFIVFIKILLYFPLPIINQINFCIRVNTRT